MRRQAMGMLVVMLMVAAFMPTASSVLAAGPTCTVAASGGTYTTMQAAVNDGGCATINVAAGTYPENVTISRDVTINGSTTGDTIVDGNNAGPVVTVRSGTVSLGYLTIQHGNNTSDRQGGGVANYGMLTVTSSTIRDNTASFAGGGIYTELQAIITNTTFSGNRALGGGAIYTSFSDSGAPVTVTNSTFTVTAHLGANATEP